MAATYRTGYAAFNSDDQKSRNKWELFIRVLTIIYCFLTLIPLSLAAGINNSSDITQQLPVNSTNRSSPSIGYVQYSVNVYCGIYITVLLLTILYEVIIVPLRYMQLVTYSKWFFHLDYIFNNLMISAYVIGFAFGLLEAVLYVIASSNYDLQGNAAGSVSTFLFAVMGMMYGTYIQFSSITYIMTAMFATEKVRRELANNNGQIQEDK